MKQNNLDISISDFKAVVGRDPKVKWFDSDEETVTKANPRIGQRFGDLPKTPLSLEESLEIGLKITLTMSS